MPIQEQMAGFAKRLGAKVAAANAEHADKPIDTGNRRLPAGIKDGVARLNAMYTKQYEDDKQGLKGQVFFRASAVALTPEEHNGEKCAGMITSQIISLCDVPAKGQREAVTFDQNWFKFQNLFKSLGIFPPDGQQGRPDYSDKAIPDRVAASQLIEGYYFAAMKALTDPVRMKTNPVYISFSTRGWTPPVTPASPNPSEMVFETWHGLAPAPPAIDPAGGVNSSPSPAAMQPSRMSAPPSPNGQPPPLSTPGSLAGTVESLVQTVMNDPDGATEESVQASEKLESMAVALGWTREKVSGAADWAAVGQMAINPPVPTPTRLTANVATLAVGSKWLFQKRSKDGVKLVNAQGQEFPAQEVEVTSVNTESRICTIKNTKDGKDVVDMKSKKPVEVKFEWLEHLDNPF